MTLLCRLQWRILRLSYPWLPLAIALWRLTTSRGIQRSRAQAKFWLLSVRIDFANLMAIALDMTHPEYWLL
ncbi:MULTISPECIES: hypothetical protein [unclassified Leptolyngbya]|uniref:hypothetical protein n=1 Tax=unclassified Leptolyngbya TaxID=2650499 RepID=UPI0016871E0B|nr:MULTISPECIES: hypothetical protein [unclassified Leptolyngbya]MBD1911672.1 hypothetical protein [Leptolyngbya sp. FACHB-8]MBD2154589.1 hypothetical protein [Leptolyngbya sp. FACHB-16]